MTIAYFSATHTRRKPKQSRSKALVDAIYQSCIKIIESSHGEKLTVSMIAKTAGVTLSSFYQYFPNIQSVVAATLLKYDQDADRHSLTERALSERALTQQQAIDFLVNAVCDRHLRLLNKYDRLYRRYHRLVNAQLCVGFNENGLAIMVDWEVWLRDFLKNYCEEPNSPPNEMTVFIATSLLTALTAGALDANPDLLMSTVFRKKIVDMMLKTLSD